MLWQSVKMAWSSVISIKCVLSHYARHHYRCPALVVLVSIADRASSQVTDAISSMGTNLLTVSISDDKENPLKITEMTDILGIGEISEAAPVGTDSFTAKYDRNSETVSVTGTSGDIWILKARKIASGRFLKSRRHRQLHTQVVIINQDLASDLLEVTNTRDAIGMEIELEGMPYTVVGVLAKSDTVTMTQSSMRPYIPFTSLMRLSDSVSGITSLCGKCNLGRHAGYRRGESQDLAFVTVRQ